MVHLHGLDEAGIKQYKRTVSVTTLLFDNHPVIKQAETFWS
jgi:hypothetical protein